MVNKNEQIKSLPLPPGSFGLPFIGETIDFLTDPDFGDKPEKNTILISSSYLGRLCFDWDLS